jgi:hypothetical protein
VKRVLAVEKVIIGGVVIFLHHPGKKWKAYISHGEHNIPLLNGTGKQFVADSREQLIDALEKHYG